MIYPLLITRRLPIDALTTTNTFVPFIICFRFHIKKKIEQTTMPMKTAPRKLHSSRPASLKKPTQNQQLSILPFLCIYLTFIFFFFFFFFLQNYEIFILFLFLFLLFLSFFFILFICSSRVNFHIFFFFVAHFRFFPPFLFLPHYYYYNYSLSFSHQR